MLLETHCNLCSPCRTSNDREDCSLFFETSGRLSAMSWFEASVELACGGLRWERNAVLGRHVCRTKLPPKNV